jgi:acyl-coenzyme A synthetase/AMP-(fatty) acid ligase
MLPETMVTMLSALRIGAVFSPLFSGYGPTAIANRLNDARPKVIVTCDGYYRRGSKVTLKSSVDQSACVGVPAKVKGEKLYCFIVLRPNIRNEQNMVDQLNALVAKKPGKTLQPDKVVFVRDLPRTRSGKIVRRLIRRVVVKEPFEKDPSLENPESLELLNADLESIS